MNPGINVDTWLAGRDLTDQHFEVVHNRGESTPFGIALFSPQGSGDQCLRVMVFSRSGFHVVALERRVNLENCTVA